MEISKVNCKKTNKTKQNRKQTTYTHLLTTAMGKLKAGRPSLTVMPSALQEIKL